MLCIGYFSKASFHLQLSFARFERIGGNVNDNATYHGTTVGGYLMQLDFNLTMYHEDRQYTSLNFGGNKSYCMFNGAKTLVMASSWYAYSSGTDSGGDYKQYHIHGRVGQAHPIAQIIWKHS